MCGERGQDADIGLRLWSEGDPSEMERVRCWGLCEISEAPSKARPEFLFLVVVGLESHTVPDSNVQGRHKTANAGDLSSDFKFSFIHQP